MMMREQDSESAVCTRSHIRIRVSAHPNEAPDTPTPYFIMLCKTNFGRGTPAGIQMPAVTDFYDADSIPAGNTLPPWMGFRLVSDNGQETLANTKVLKIWRGNLEATGNYRAWTTNYGLLEQENNAVGTNNGFVGSTPGGDPVTINDPSSVTYTPTRPSYKDIIYTHKYGPHGHTAKFEDVTTSDPIVEAYFVVALGVQTDSIGTNGYRVNGLCKTVFQSS